MPEQSYFNSEPRSFRYIGKLLKALLYFGAISFYIGLAIALYIFLGKLGLAIIVVAVGLLALVLVLILISTDRHPLHEVNVDQHLDHWLANRNAKQEQPLHLPEEEPGSEKKPTYH